MKNNAIKLALDLADSRAFGEAGDVLNNPLIETIIQFDCGDYPKRQPSQELTAENRSIYIAYTNLMLSASEDCRLFIPDLPYTSDGVSSQEFTSQQIVDDLNKLKSTPRIAYYKSIIALSRPHPLTNGGVVITIWSGITRGYIAYKIRGCYHHGYDNIFIPDGQLIGHFDASMMSLAEMSPKEVKIYKTHRSVPLQLLATWITSSDYIDKFGFIRPKLY